ncbi:uncharacterized protein RJT21DRAFT_113528 [Scheffersomyces amazonensis]|uniref:uncharacterized protein n=1 Tax=Scheffersomyces amazonensis TaxID=1078765 RepID=UPI00315CD424
MNRLNDKISQLREIAESNQSSYYELQQVWTAKTHETTEREYTIKALQTQNQFLQRRFDQLQNTANDAKQQLAHDSDRIDLNEARISELTKKIESIEQEYDELQLKYIQVEEELRAIHQVLDGAV